MKTQLKVLGVLCALPLFAVGCSDSNTGDYTYIVYDAAGLQDGGSTINPVPPFIGPPIDRVGRPAIAKLLLNPFNLVAGGRSNAQLQDAYNTSTSQTDQTVGWPSFAAAIATNLAAWDGINNPPLQAAGGQCGDQPLATAAPIVAARYQPLATILANDVLNVDISQKTCARYLGVELGVGTDCGGREPKVNVVDITLNILQGGTLTTATPPGATLPLSTGITSDPDGPTVANFPFLLPPT